MVRKLMLMTVVLLLAITGIASARPGVSTMVAQQDAAADDEVSANPGVESFVLGERYSNELFDLEIQDAFSVDSPLYPGYDEVRLSAAFRHHSDLPWLPSAYALTGEYGYPELQLRDGAGIIHDLPTNVLPLIVDVVEQEKDDTGAVLSETIIPVQLGELSYHVGGFSLAMQPRGIPARWSVGFRVPSASSHDLTIQASFGGVVFAEWDVDSDPVPTVGWDRPTGFDSAGLGDSIVWGDSLLVEPKAVATVVCADPSYGHVTVDTSVLVGVESVVDADTIWPAVNYPEVVAIAVWDDGTAARYSGELVAFYDDDTDDELFDRNVHRYGEHAIIPPRTTHDRFMEFMAPRDRRFGEVTDNPDALVLYPPNGPAIWVDVDTTPTGTIAEYECAVPSFHLFSVDRSGEAPEPPLPDLEQGSTFDA